MPAEKPLTIATYAAGASLAAITLVYVFGPTFFLDGDANQNLKSSSRRPPIGLHNPANDCFINSVLQALAGLPDLRKYLIRETHRRKLDGSNVYKVTTEEKEASNLTDIAALKLEALRVGIVTQALKDILDKLNERPIYKKIISAQEFVVALEYAFRTRISRQQQDAQELLQVVAERLCDEYHAGQKMRQRVHDLSLEGLQIASSEAEVEEQGQIDKLPTVSSMASKDLQEVVADKVPEDGFPLEGKIESQIECQTCMFKPKPSVSTFVTLTLNVPQRNSATLNQCFDGMLKVEVIEDFKCDRCRLVHALKFKQGQLRPDLDVKVRELLEDDIRKIERAIEDDPEVPPEGVKLPDLKLAPKRTIKKHMRISHFPKVLAVHLSRSIYSAQYSMKNMAKVAFPETLPLGSILDQKRYRLLAVVNHKGGHNSGHYETFRRQITTLPFSTPHSFGAEGAYSQRGSPIPSTVASPRLSAQMSEKRASRTSNLSKSTSVTTHDATSIDAVPSSPSIASLDSSSSSLSISASLRRRSRPPTSAPREDANTTTPAHSVRLSTSSKLRPSMSDLARLKKKGRKKGGAADNRWWRISDDRVKESKTSEVLGMQKEVYLLFYELMVCDGCPGEEEE